MVALGSQRAQPPTRTCQVLWERRPHHRGVCL